MLNSNSLKKFMLAGLMLVLMAGNCNATSSTPKKLPTPILDVALGSLGAGIIGYFFILYKLLTKGLCEDPFCILYITPTILGMLLAAGIPAITFGVMYKKFKTEKARLGNKTLTFKEFIKKTAMKKKIAKATIIAPPVIPVSAIILNILMISVIFVCKTS